MNVFELIISLNTNYNAKLLIKKLLNVEILQLKKFSNFGLF